MCSSDLGGDFLILTVAVGMSPVLEGYSLRVASDGQPAVVTQASWDVPTGLSSAEIVQRLEAGAMPEHFAPLAVAALVPDQEQVSNAGPTPSSASVGTNENSSAVIPAPGSAAFDGAVLSHHSDEMGVQSATHRDADALDGVASQVAGAEPAAGVPPKTASVVMPDAFAPTGPPAIAKETAGHASAPLAEVPPPLEIGRAHV